MEARSKRPGTFGRPLRSRVLRRRGTVPDPIPGKRPARPCQAVTPSRSPTQPQPNPSGVLVSEKARARPPPRFTLQQEANAPRPSAVHEDRQCLDTQVPPPSPFREKAGLPWPGRPRPPLPAATHPSRSPTAAAHPSPSPNLPQPIRSTHLGRNPRPLAQVHPTARSKRPATVGRPPRSPVPRRPGTVPEPIPGKSRTAPAQVHPTARSLFPGPRPSQHDPRPVSPRVTFPVPQ